jgi:hypothetical protein
MKVWDKVGQALGNLQETPRISIRCRNVCSTEHDEEDHEHGISLEDISTHLESRWVGSSLDDDGTWDGGEGRALVAIRGHLDYF